MDIINGDCLIEMLKIPDKSQTMIFADLPQGITKNKWDVTIPFSPLWAQFERIIKDNGVIILMTNQPFTSEAVTSNRRLFKYSMIWHKNYATQFFNAKKRPLPNHEDILIFYKKPPIYYPQKTTGHARKVSTAHHKRNSIKTTNYGDHKAVGYDSTERYPKTVLNFKSDKQMSSLNATQKPVALIEWFLKSFTLPGDNVLDPCCGSGTTLIACNNLGRNSIGIEKDGNEFNKAKIRLCPTS